MHIHLTWNIIKLYDDDHYDKKAIKVILKIITDSFLTPHANLSVYDIIWVQMLQKSTITYNNNNNSNKSNDNNKWNLHDTVAIKPAFKTAVCVIMTVFCVLHLTFAAILSNK